MKKKRKFNLILIIFVIVLVLGLGYAYLTTTLNINGTTNVDSNSWNIYWDNVQVSSGSVSASTPVIDTSKTTVTFNVHLSKPGDYYEFTVDAKNTGSIDAMIDTITKTTIPNYLDYNVTYTDGMELAVKHLLKSNNSETYIVRVEYRTDINPADLPSSSQSLNLSFGVNYLQGDSSALTRMKVMYHVKHTYVTVGATVPNGLALYSDISAARRSFSNNNFLVKLYIGVPDNKVYNAYIVLLKDGEELLLKPGGATYNETTSTYNNDSIYYEENIDILDFYFDEDNCEETANSYECEDDDTGYDATVYKNGAIFVTDYWDYCQITTNGKAFCYVDND